MEMHNDDLIDFSQQKQHSPSSSQPLIIEKSTQHAQHQRPPPIVTEWEAGEASMDKDENEKETTLKNLPITFTLPCDSYTIEEKSAAAHPSLPPPLAEMMCKDPTQ